MKQAIEIMHEDAAKSASRDGWECNTCSAFYMGQEAERSARYCCCTSFPCECGERYQKPWTCCQDCRTKKEMIRHLAREMASWDGQMIYSHAADRFFSDPEAAYDYYADEEDDFNSMMFVLTKPDNGRVFGMEEFLDDSLPTEDGELGADAREIDRAVNDWIQAHGPYSWHPGKIAWDGQSSEAVQ